MGERAIGLVNYFFVWLAIHQLGYAWRDDRFRGRLVWAAAGAVSVAGLVTFGPYPLAMVGFPGLEISNTSPPTLALLALGVCQAGLILFLEPAARRVLASARIWTATVLVNGMIMSLFLWHMTAMILAYGLFYLGASGAIALVPDSEAWWMTRPLFMMSFALLLVPIVALVQRFERPTGRVIEASRHRLVAGASLVCVGLAMISDGGVATAAGVRVLPNLLPFLGTGLAGFGPLRGLGSASSSRTS